MTISKVSVRIIRDYPSYCYSLFVRHVMSVQILMRKILARRFTEKVDFYITFISHNQLKF
jgi:hypothetical protein